MSLDYEQTKQNIIAIFAAGTNYRPEDVRHCTRIIDILEATAHPQHARILWGNQSYLGSPEELHCLLPIMNTITYGEQHEIWVSPKVVAMSHHNWHLVPTHNDQSFVGVFIHLAFKLLGVMATVPKLIESKNMPHSPDDSDVLPSKLELVTKLKIAKKDNITLMKELLAIKSANTVARGKARHKKHMRPVRVNSSLSVPERGPSMSDARAGRATSVQSNEDEEMPEASAESNEDEFLLSTARANKKAGDRDDDDADHGTKAALIPPWQVADKSEEYARRISAPFLRRSERRAGVRSYQPLSNHHRLALNTQTPVRRFPHISEANHEAATSTIPTNTPSKPTQLVANPEKSNEAAVGFTTNPTNHNHGGTTDRDSESGNKALAPASVEKDANRVAEEKSLIVNKTVPLHEGSQPLARIHLAEQQQRTAAPHGALTSHIEAPITLHFGVDNTTRGAQFIPFVAPGSTKVASTQTSVEELIGDGQVAMDVTLDTDMANTALRLPVVAQRPAESPFAPLNAKVVQQALISMAVSCVTQLGSIISRSETSARLRAWVNEVSITQALELEIFGDFVVTIMTTIEEIIQYPQEFTPLERSPDDKVWFEVVHRLLTYLNESLQRVRKEVQHEFSTRQAELVASTEMEVKRIKAGMEANYTGEVSRVHEKLSEECNSHLGTIHKLRNTIVQKGSAFDELSAKYNETINDMTASRENMTKSSTAKFNMLTAEINQQRELLTLTESRVEALQVDLRKERESGKAALIAMEMAHKAEIDARDREIDQAIENDTGQEKLWLTQLNQSRLENCKLKGEIGKSKKALEDSQYELEALADQVRTTDQKIAGMRNEFAAEKLNWEQDAIRCTSELKQKLEQYEKSSQLDKQLIEKQRTTANLHAIDIEQYKGRLATAQISLESFKERLDDYDKQNNKRLEELTTATNDNQLLAQKLIDVTNKYDEEALEKDSLTKQALVLKDDIQQANVKIAHLEGQVKVHHDLRFRLGKRVNTLLRKKGLQASGDQQELREMDLMQGLKDSEVIERTAAKEFGDLVIRKKRKLDDRALYDSDTPEERKATDMDGDDDGGELSPLLIPNLLDTASGGAADDQVIGDKIASNLVQAYESNQNYFKPVPKT
jgi:hypothetical protein